MNEAVEALIAGRTILLGRVPDDVAEQAIERARELGVELNIVDAHTKHCPGCDQELPVDSFYPKGKNPRTGTPYRTTLCRECHKAKRREPEWRAYEKDRMREWREKNRDKWNRYMRKWRKKNPGRDNRWDYMITILDDNGTKVRVPRDELEAHFEKFGGVCAYCGAPWTEVDHFVPFTRGGGNDWSNLVPACRSCNASKNNKDPREWCDPDTYERISAILSC